MKAKYFLLILAIGLLLSFNDLQRKLPKGFIYVKDVATHIRVSLRYATNHNFIGKPINGYHANKAITTIETAQALKKVQTDLDKLNLSLIIYDAYRPQKAVNHFVKWARNLKDTLMKKEFYPNVAKKNLFKNGYISSHSRHSSGSTVDVSIYSNTYKVPLDMGSPYDFFGKQSWVNYDKLTKKQKYHRQLLQKVMLKNGFRNYSKEWWHFTLRNEPYRNQHFDFDIE